ncbi:MAG: YibE/F family protein, partial [Armatimonadota bacterium]|nr:YibE/F family protein [Armatimonadota bacterium]
AVPPAAAPAPGPRAPAPPAAAPDHYAWGRVLAVLADEERELAGMRQVVQLLRVRVHSGPERGRVVEASHAAPAGVGVPRLQAGEAVVVVRTQDATGLAYFVVDRFRLPPLLAVFGLFLALAALFARTRGVTAVVGLGVTLLVLAGFIVPQILAGRPPLLVSLAGALLIACTSIYLAHGVSRRTTVALAGTLATLALAGGLAVVAVSLTRLFGLGSEEALYLQAPLEGLNLRGLLLGGIILGALGVLDDVTTSQAAAVAELARAAPHLSGSELVARGLAVGREHITALVNTLVLAYAGASFPLFLLFSVNREQPLWVILNGEFVAEEAVRTLVGSIALVVAVPITTVLAARWLRGDDAAGHP